MYKSAALKKYYHMSGIKRIETMFYLWPKLYFCTKPTILYLIQVCLVCTRGRDKGKL